MGVEGSFDNRVCTANGTSIRCRSVDVEEEKREAIRSMISWLGGLIGCWLGSFVTAGKGLRRARPRLGLLWSRFFRGLSTCGFNTKAAYTEFSRCSIKWNNNLKY